MAKTNFILFDKTSGELFGLLDKHDVPVFMECREINNYHVMEIKEKKVNDVFEGRDLGSYIPVYLNDLLIFPHEEPSLNEIFFSNMDIYVQLMPNVVKLFTETLRLEKEEEQILKVALGQVMIYLADIYDELEPIEEVLDYRRAMMSVLRHFDLKKGFE